jgi:iron complex outermembrane recepter protein
MDSASISARQGNTKVGIMLSIIRKNTKAKTELVAPVTSIFSGLLLMASSPIGMANELALEEIIVTAQKKSESLQDVPISMSVVSGEKIQQAGIKNIEDLSSYVPNLKMSKTLVGNAIFIRGVGSGINRGFEQSVGMFIDGIYAGRGNQFRSPFMDVSHIEVLKGPQGSLFGKNTIAGAININTSKPTDEFFTELSAEFEPRYGGQDLSLIVSGPTSENTGVRFTAKRSEFDGYLKNIITDKDEPSREESVARLVVTWQPTESADLRLKLEKGYFDTEGSSFQVVNTDGAFYLRGIPVSQFEDYIDPREQGKVDLYSSAKNFDGQEPESSTDNDAVVLNADFQLTDTLTLTSVTGYSAFEYSQVVDGDSSDIEFISSELFEDFKQYSQEFRFVGYLGDNIDYVAGAFASVQDMYNFQIIDGDLGSILPGGTLINGIFPIEYAKTSGVSDFDQKTTSLGLFGQAKWQVTRDFHVTFGLRVGREEKDVEKSQIVATFGEREPTQDPIKLAMSDVIIGVVPHELDGKRTVDTVSPTLNFQYFASESAMYYLRLAKGSKSGGFNASDGGGDPAKFEFDDEKAENIEVGSKLTLADGAATVNAAYFYTDFSNRQFATLTPSGTVVGNAASSVSQGVELDFKWRPLEYLVLNGSLAYLHSRYANFDDAGCTAEQEREFNGQGCVQDLTGETTEFAAPWSGTIGAVLLMPVGDNWGASFGVDLNYSDGYYLSSDIDDNDYQEEYVKVNARLAFRDLDGRWELALLGKNLTDELTKTNGDDVPKFIGAHFAGVAPPRMISLQAKWRY